MTVIYRLNTGRNANLRGVALPVGSDQTFGIVLLARLRFSMAASVCFSSVFFLRVAVCWSPAAGMTLRIGSFVVFSGVVDTFVRGDNR